MKGKKSDVQARILEVSNRALHLLCGNHNLNLVICDAVASSTTAASFYGLLQRVYVFWSSSTHR